MNSSTSILIAASRRLGALGLGLASLGYLAAAPAAAQVNDRFGGTRGVMAASVGKKPLKVRKVAVYNEDRSGRGARIAAFVRRELARRGVRVDPNSDILLIIRAGIQAAPGASRGSAAGGVPLNPRGQARLSAEPLFRQPEHRGPARAANSTERDRLGGAAVLLKLRGLIRRSPGGAPRGSVYTMHLQLEAPGKPPLWQGHAIAAGKSANPDFALRQMAQMLLRHLGRPARQRSFRTR